MTEDRHTQQRNELIKSLEQKGIRDTKVLNVMKQLPRHLFIDEGFWVDPYEDAPQKIGYGQTISQPYIVALMTENLELKVTDRVLELGTGCGYQTAILCELANEVYSIERIDQLNGKADKNLKTLGYTNYFLRCGDGTIGWSERGPFDAIIVTAQAPEVPEILSNQLAEGGRLVIPVGKAPPQKLIKLTKKGNTFIETYICGVYFVPLIGKYAWQE